MDINVTVTHVFTLGPALQSLVDNVVGAALRRDAASGETAAPVSAETPAPKSRKKAADKVEVPAVEVSPAPAAPKATAAPAVQVEVAAAAQLTLEDVAKLVTATAQKVGMEPLKELFAKQFKINRLVELPKERFAELVAAMSALPAKS